MLSSVLQFSSDLDEIRNTKCLQKSSEIFFFFVSEIGTKKVIAYVYWTVHHCDS